MDEKIEIITKYHEKPPRTDGKKPGVDYVERTVKLNGEIMYTDRIVYVPTAELWINIEDVTTQNCSGYYKAFQNAEGDIILYDPSGSAWNDWNVGLLITKDGVKIFLNPDNAGSLSESLFTDKFSELAEDVTIGGNYWQQLHTDNVIN